MAGWECSRCDGSGYEEITIVRAGLVVKTKGECIQCFGAGTFTNGKPDVGWDCGITDPSEELSYKWGEQYEKEVEKGMANMKERWWRV